VPQAGGNPYPQYPSGDWDRDREVQAPISLKSFAPNTTAGCAKAGPGAKRCSEEEVHLVARVRAYRIIGI
jgi:hypothetical protein